MKNLFLKVLTIFVVIVSGCSTLKKSSKLRVVTLTGTIEEIGMTTFQYGTHKIKTKHNTYALRSDRTDLNAFVGKQVILKGTKVTGYPLEGGPELLEVSSVSISKFQIRHE